MPLGISRMSYRALLQTMSGLAVNVIQLRLANSCLNFVSVIGYDFVYDVADLSNDW